MLFIKIWNEHVVIKCQKTKDKINKHEKKFWPFRFRFESLISQSRIIDRFVLKVSRNTSSCF